MEIRHFGRYFNIHLTNRDYRTLKSKVGSGALSGKMLLVRIIEEKKLCLFYVKLG